MAAYRIEDSEFVDGSWICQLDALLELTRLEPRTNGATMAAELILS